MKKVTSLPNGRVVVDMAPLDELQKLLKKQMVARVGVLGGSPAREEGVVTNADLGVIHEYGSEKAHIPARSWLRMPLQLYMPAVYKEIAGTFFTALERTGMAADTVYKQKFSLLGKRAEAVIQKAFASRGFGHWIANKPSTIAAKGSDAPLIDTAEFRKSITSDVKVKDLS